MLGRGINLNRGDVARLWLDSLDGRVPFKDRFPLLFETCTDQNCIVDKFKCLDQISSFRRRMSPEMMKQWEEMNKEMLNLKQSDWPDEVYWKLDSSGKYTTKSMYTWLERDIAGSKFEWIWDAKLPLKIQIFLWQMAQNAILTRDNMKNRLWPGDPCCSFCDKLETAQHLLFLCPVSRVVWRIVGSMLGTDCCPNSVWQYYAWMYRFLPGLDKIYTVGLAAICWAIWLALNHATFKNK